MRRHLRQSQADPDRWAIFEGNTPYTTDLDRETAERLVRSHNANDDAAAKEYPPMPEQAPAPPPSALKAVALELLEKWRDSKGSVIGYECEGRTYQERVDCVAACDAQFADYKARIEAAEPEAGP